MNDLPDDEVPQNDPSQVKLVWARSIEDNKRYDRLIVSAKTMRNFRDARQYSKIGEYLGLIVGVRGVNNISRKTALACPKAIYKGVKRPIYEEEDNSITETSRDEDIFVFVSTPEHTFSYPAEQEGHPFSEKTDRLPSEPKPPKSVFAVYVDYNPELVNKVKKESESSLVIPSLNGVILYWEWVFGDDGDPTLPALHQKRYDCKVWPL